VTREDEVKLIKGISIFLRKLSNGDIPKYVDIGYGMCGAIESFVYMEHENNEDLYAHCYHIIDAAIATIARTWKHFSGDRTYPIAYPKNEYNHKSAFYVSYVPMWKNEYGRRRKELCGLIADELHKSIKGE